MRPFNLQRVVGWLSMPLTQRRYANGKLFVLGIIINNKLDSLDVRFFAEDNDILIPTMKGFRVRNTNFKQLFEALKQNPRDIGDRVLWQGHNRSLHVRHLSDRYGSGIDFRYYSETEKYTGWEPRGVRFSITDYIKFQSSLLALDITHKEVLSLPDILSGRLIANSGDRGKGKQESNAGARAGYVNDVLVKFLDGEA